MKIGIIGAMEEEILLLKSKMSNKKEWTEAKADFIEGQIGEVEVVLVRCGIGKVNAALTTTLLLAKHDIDLIVNTGSAGGIGAGLHVGDVVIASEMAYHDVDATVFGYSIGQVPQMPARYIANQGTIEKTITAAKKTGLTPVKGLIVTSDSFIASQAQTDVILSNFPDALASEMEGAAIAQVCYQFDVPFVIIRAMSDVADEEAGVSFDEFIIEAGKKSAEMVLELVASLA
ncbi:MULTISPECIES: 5'-methylthioadenosine/adenosylhomocysteine nucleosidase [Carnobacterium]|uniref:5'-methylthioadenosine/S-adenosylhomocysteine nucleosidase n=1 Tax=Carnobacterium maltaromaticum TaxID=2751 RepID=A0AAW9JX30_CARML|nr:5'-methylthioadenosine/adenosylhomocysteine nucleosidase [Carnobacterium maltaromaticum]KRN73889.1 5-methylthioadenosine S-adenosylhomocysteine nucleosidase [Carnobacterium maltaromaticum]KRN87396.1 5-methylthioadenosine S-adenosylhomocysteine nucleosidase [Carnobacterium maltaromaticum]MBC9810788.1 5'-methylthioadenosine/adenosylhomocysteine nucleosidase [Carnobacterium maltaromaticum]MDT1945061.1 5'-methylthioadenosine/adenosylhomocysteine nucleosidase [Carnobacterium maltaromaticum]MDT19